MNCRSVIISVCVALSSFASVEGSERGKEVFRAKCIGCHAISCNRVGPKLEGIIGRRAGSLNDFEGYTAEMKSAGFVWSKKKLDEFLADPNGTLPGTLMASAGQLDGHDDRRHLIDFLGSGDTSLDLCF